MRFVDPFKVNRSEIAKNCKPEICKKCFQFGKCLKIENALKKQIRQKPKITIYNGYCPQCGNAFGKDIIEKSALTNFRYFRYCPSCGQALDWSE